ncbi:MAG TPA: chloride channel protein [Lacunisphaera sp.]|jgi:H+/Cl- antiporter ClcA/CBS domain-containing protein
MKSGSLSATHSSTATEEHDALSDFTTDRRVLLLCALAIPIGAIAAVVAKVLLWLIAVITNAVFFFRYSTEAVTFGGQHFGWWGILVPALGGLVIGLMARYGSEKIRGHGIPEALEAILLGRSLINPRVAILKPISSAISIGTGGPYGAEGPIIMTGGAFGSLFAQLFHLTSAERKTLLVAGAAAGMAAVFATPVAGVLLAVELLLFEWKPRSFIPVAVASIVAAVVREPLLGVGPIFPVTAHAILDPKFLGCALLVGICVGLLASLLTNIVYACEDGFAKLPIHWMWWPAIGGLLVGIGGYLDPRVLGVGYETIHSLMRGEILGTALIGLIVAKGLVWSISLGSGTSGGVLAPLLMVGGGMGALLGTWMGIGDPGLWAIVGMAAIMGGAMSAPLTGIIFVLELTHDLNTMPALLVGTVAAFGVTVLLLRRSILTEKLARRGQHISREYSVDVFALIRVGDVMDRTPPIVSDTTTVAELAAQLTQPGSIGARRQATLIERDGLLVGIVTRGDLLRAQRANGASVMTVARAGTANPITVFADETLDEALNKMLQHNVGRLPVVARENARKIVGYLGRPEILGARTRGREEESHRERGPLGKRLG